MNGERRARVRATIARGDPMVALRWLFASLLAGALLLAAGAPPAHAQGAVPALVLPATAAENARYSLQVRRPEPGVARQRPVGIDLRVLDDRQGFAAPEVRVDLFEGRTVTLTKERLARRAAANYTWYGRLSGHPGGFAVLTVVDGRISGTIELGNSLRGRYQIQSTSDGLTLLREIDASTFPDDHPGGGEPPAPAGDAAPLATPDASAQTATSDTAVTEGDTGSTIDVMIVYSNQTAVAAGAAIGAQVQQAIDTANLVYAQSGIAMQLRLVYAGPADYAESGDFPTDLNRLTSGTDGYMDGVAALRNAYGADLVSLFVENAQYCGYGWIGPSANYAFSVINRGCASGNYSFPHELGHNFGARHDTYVDPTNTPYAYGHGWVDIGQRWRDVMAYNNACAAVGVSCTRIAYLSNPNLTYGSPPDPLGSAATADTVRVHNQNAPTVASFRASAGGSTGCTWSLSPSGATVSQAAGSGSVGITTQAGCAWNAASSAPWLAPGAGASGSGSLAFSYGANSGPPRTGTITIGGVAFTVSQASGCVYALSPGSAAVAAAGGAGSTTLSTGTGCAWTAASSAAWLTVSSAASGTGSATVGYSVTSNTGAARSANLTVGGRTFVVSQAAASIAAAASVDPGALDLGSVMVGKTSAVKSASLTNVGGGTLTIASLAMAGANPADFRRSGTCAINTVLAAGQSCRLDITFSPTTTGARSAALSVATSAGNVTLGLGGTGRKAGRK